ncbi:MAG TPA: hypothetical protein VLT36_15705 [Candidatus Dormibacteraeota bacterium]|nr:hypothetical protein [Candidatus Dormibacteraeota bacterium]
MNFDLRLPIGVMFSLFGLILVVFGLLTNNNEMYQHSLGMNINLRWGAVLLIFGVFMLFLTWRASKKPPENVGTTTSKPADVASKS